MSKKVRNILYIMADQLRTDYLSCYGHPRLKTPNLDALAARGTRFTGCHVQGPVCGPSRASSYTGRYVTSHGVTWNFVPQPAGVMTMGDHLRAGGLRVAVVGKTHVVGDRPGMLRMGLDPESDAGILIDEGGFEPYARDDGVLPDKDLDYKNPPYNQFLRATGYDARNAWHDFANSGAGPAGEVLSGWQMRHARHPARVPDAHSETAWTTDRGIDFIREQGDKAWCLHLSYIKPHWPYIVSAPYNDLFGPEDVIAANRSEAERRDAQAVIAAFRLHPESQAFSRDDVRSLVIPTYMGLVKQLDDHLGRLFKALDELGRRDDTMIVFTSDHGDNLGDHWLGEKEMFYKESVGVPLIVVDPTSSPGRRGSVCDELVESIDLLPTFRDALGMEPDDLWLEGQSLMPQVRGDEVPAREAVFSELDYAFYEARRRLNVGVNAARATMVRTRDWKYVRFEGFAPQLHDMKNDPDELSDLGCDPAREAVRREMEARIADWRAERRNRVTVSDRQILAKSDRNAVGGVRIGEW